MLSAGLSSHSLTGVAALRAKAERDTPELEFVGVPEKQSVKIWAHGYPFRTVRWHFHPEYEIHLVTTTSGTRYVGDHIGQFKPGDLVMVGPNLPHNWISAVAPDAVVAERCLVLQFTEASIQRCVEAFPEMQGVESLLAESRKGILFGPQTARRMEPIMRQMLQASGPARASLFLRALDELALDTKRVQFASGAFKSDSIAYLSAPINRALHYIAERLTEDICEADVAACCKQPVSSFSRAFRKRTGETFVQYVNAMRVELACQHLTHDERSITDICFEVGFHNVSNFNRQFAAIKQMTPSEFRRCYKRRCALL